MARRLVGSRWVWLAASVLVTSWLAFAACFNYNDPQEVGLTWNMVSGKVELQERQGWHARPPWVLVTTIDTRPQRVCITSSAHAAVNCRLVAFNTAAHKEFVAVEGFRWYWWSNRFSFNSGYREEYRGFRDVLRGYAFSSEQYSFIQVLEEYEQPS